MEDMILFNEFNNYLGTFEKEFDSKLEKMVKEVLWVDDDEINHMVRGLLVQFYTDDLMIKRFNNSLKGKNIRYECIDNIIYRVSYDDNEEIKEKVIIPTTEFRELFYCHCLEYYHSRICEVAKQVLLKKCCELENMNDTDIIKDTYTKE